MKTKGNVCFLSMNKRGTNSLDQKLLDELYEKLCLILEEDKVKVVVLKSDLPFGFSSGLDLRSFMDDKQAVFAERVYNAVYKSFQISQAITQSSKIFIAALSGPVIGSAASIAFSCDFRIAALGTWFWLPDVQYGGLLADGGIELLTKLIGNSRTFMSGLTNDRINLDEANKWGLIYRVVELQKLKEMAFTFAERLSGLSFKTLSIHKKIINEGLLSTFQKEKLKEILSEKETYFKLKSYMQSNQNL
ncbi:MAG: enoyl-CoA hydratase/isomerase family protein [Dysgonamonadaceae bacterium]|nr:enoyl-CoA hydratase/isomerase family protein [Dysgonamonadaceae bacterium]